MPKWKKEGVCSECNTTQGATLHVHIRQSGAKGYMWRCDGCGKLNPFKSELFISNEKVEQHLSPEEIEALPVIMPDLSNRCVRCGERFCELHHWAPRAIFGKDADNWPKDYLCKPCHDLWHSMVTPQLVK